MDVRHGRSVALLLTLAALGPQAEAQAQEAQLVDAGGHRLEMVLVGAGSPAVVFDAGMIGGMQNWAPVRDSVAQHAQTVIFERAGFGHSEIGPSPRTASQLSRELHTALGNAGIEFPIVLVGHSAGGMFSRVFAHLYPADVAGLVFVDSAMEAVYEYMEDSDSVRWASYVEEVSSLYEPPPGWFGQWVALPTSLDEARESWPLPDVPTVVLSALTPAGEWPIESDRDMEVWEAAQREFAKRIPEAEHIVFPDAHHVSILQEPLLRRKIVEVWLRAVGG